MLVARQRWVMRWVPEKTPEPTSHGNMKPGEYTLARVAYERQILVHDIRGPARCKILCSARAEIAITLFEFGWSKNRIAKFLHRHWSTIHSYLEKHNARQSDQPDQPSSERVGRGSGKTR